ncbi:sugar transferase [Actinomyces vulturis]|uniref:sugar transferase n=1 Tax=Actinomyces vulturis TaxID=1857645 RepID=UPI000B0ED506|nr:sugar transferase [Actinomyces vulturis]
MIPQDKVRHLVRLGVLVLDFFAIIIAFTLATHLRGDIGFLNDDATLNNALTRVRPVGVIVWMLMIAAFGGYATREYGAGVEAYRRVFNASLATVSVFALGLFLTQTSLSRSFFLLLFTIGIPLVLLFRMTGRRILHFLYQRGFGMKRVLIVGTDLQAAELSRMLNRAPWLGMKPIGVVDSKVSFPQPTQHHQLPVFNPSDGLLPLADNNDVDLILFASGSVPESTDFRRFVWQFEGHHTQLAVMPSLVDVAADRIRTRPIAGLPIVYVEDPRSQGALSRGKRLFDFVLASLILIIISPLMIGTAFGVKLTDGGPVLFKQTRVGRDGRMFTMLKFRSMVVDAETKLAELRGGNSTNTVMFKLEHDPRVTPIGRIIRRLSIDELPQLINVLRGDMSLIGPRPPLPREVVQYSDDEWRRLRVRPGLTGLWQVSGRSDLSWDETIRLDLYYIDNWSLLQDLSILMKTLRAVLSSRGAY